MVHYIALYKLAGDVEDEKLEEMIRSCRSQLFRIQEVHNVRCGKQIGDNPEYPFFVSIDFENLDRVALFRKNPRAVKFETEVIEPNTTDCLELIYETEPGKNVRVS